MCTRCGRAPSEEGLNPQGICYGCALRQFLPPREPRGSEVNKLRGIITQWVDRRWPDLELPEVT